MAPTQILNKRNASKSELRHALAQALDLPCPDFEQKAPSEFAALRTIWCDYYRQQAGLDYQFAARDGRALADLEKKLSNIGQGNIVATWQAMLQKLPEFYRTRAFTLPAINSGFNGIVASIRQQKNEKTGVSQSYAERIVSTLRG